MDPAVAPEQMNAEAVAAWQAMAQRVLGLEQALHEQQQWQAAQAAHAAQPHDDAPAGGGSRVRPPKPEKYNGSLGKADQWCFEVEKYFECCGVHDPQCVPYAGAMLTGNAAIWWRSVCQESQTPITTWAGFKADLIHNFKHLDDVKLARDRLRTLTQRTSVASFYADFTRAIFQIPGITEEEKMDRFMAGLKPPLRREILLREPTTFRELTKMASKLDTLLYQADRRSYMPSGMARSQMQAGRPSGFRQGGSSATPMELGAIQAGPSTSKAAYPRNQLSSAERDKLRREGRCFYCRELGHVADRCPSKPGNEKRAGKAWVR